MTCSALRNPSHFSQNACSDFHYNLHCLAYDLHAESLEAVFPFRAVLPERELDLSKIVLQEAAACTMDVASTVTVPKP